MIEKVRQLVTVHHQLGSDGADDLNVLQVRWTFLDPNFYEVYNLIVQNYENKKCG